MGVDDDVRLGDTGGAGGEVRTPGRDCFARFGALPGLYHLAAARRMVLHRCDRFSRARAATTSAAPALQLRSSTRSLTTGVSGPVGDVEAMAIQRLGARPHV